MLLSYIYMHESSCVKKLPHWSLHLTCLPLNLTMTCVEGRWLVPRFIIPIASEQRQMHQSIVLIMSLFDVWLPLTHNLIDIPETLRSIQVKNINNYSRWKFASCISSAKPKSWLLDCLCNRPRFTRNQWDFEIWIIIQNIHFNKLCLNFPSVNGGYLSGLSEWNYRTLKSMWHLIKFRSLGHYSNSFSMTNRWMQFLRLINQYLITSICIFSLRYYDRLSLLDYVYEKVSLL